MNLGLTDLQTDVLIRELSQIVQNDRYPLSVRIVTPKEILAKLRAEPERPLMPLLQHYAPPRGEDMGGAVNAQPHVRYENR